MVKYSTIYFSEIPSVLWVTSFVFKVSQMKSFKSLLIVYFLETENKSLKQVLFNETRMEPHLTITTHPGPWHLSNSPTSWSMPIIFHMTFWLLPFPNLIRLLEPIKLSESHVIYICSALPKQLVTQWAKQNGNLKDYGYIKLHADKKIAKCPKIAKHKQQQTLLLKTWISCLNIVKENSRLYWNIYRFLQTFPHSTSKSLANFNNCLGENKMYYALGRLLNKRLSRDFILILNLETTLKRCLCADGSFECESSRDYDFAETQDQV